MTTQLQWEADAYQEGMDKFFDDEQEARLKGKTDETAVGSSVLRQKVLDIAAHLEMQTQRKSGGVGGSYLNALRVAASRYDLKTNVLYQDYNIPAYIGLLTLLQASYARNQKGKYLAPLAVEIGRRLEYDQQLYVFRQDNGAFVAKIEESLAKQGVGSLRHKLKTYQKKWRNAEMRWESWGEVKRAQVGMKVLKAILTVMDDCFELTKKHDGRHPRHYIETTLGFDDFVIDETDLLSRTMPIMRPMVEPPLPWQRVGGDIIGGFHTQELRSASPFIKVKGPEHKEYVDKAYPYKHIAAVNHMQRTAWKINPHAASVVRKYVEMNIPIDGLPHAEKLEVPPHPGDDATEEEHTDWLQDAKSIHGKNKENACALIVLGQSLKMVDALKGRDFWFTYTADFRGRVYCSSTTLSPQGADHIKAMIKFSEGKALGREGIRALAIHGAGKYGYDKVNLDDRVRWVIQHEEQIRSFVEHPFTSTSRSFLADADKPFQFAAFCYEWDACNYGRDADYVSHLPVGLDGTCNGLQHYGAILRDPRGGAGVNLMDSELPEDIYQEVADELITLLEREACGGVPLAVRMLEMQPDRKCAKRPVMTLPYGSTQQSCRLYIRDWVGEQLGKRRDHDKLDWELATYVTPFMWEAIGNVVVAARAAMAWLQECSGLVAKTGTYARWRSPADFPVFQHYAERATVRVSTDLFGRITLNLEGAAEAVNGRRARSSVAPNYIHGMDASHLVFTTLDAEARGINSLAFVHDDFGTHAADIAELADIIRITFVRMYLDKDWLEVWKKELEGLHEGLELPEPPTPGDLDILQVLDSTYFFS